MIIVCCLSFAILLGVIHIWVNALDEIDWEADKYCYNCKYGMCMETPKSSKCQKWRDESENKGSE